MARYIIRTSGEFSLVVEAKSAEEAHKLADTTPLEEWDVAWSECEVDEIETSEVD